LCHHARFHFDKNEIPCLKKIREWGSSFWISTGVAAVALEHTVEMEKLEPNNWRDAAA
jgi:hypothetical protein